MNILVEEAQILLDKYQEKDNLDIILLQDVDMEGVKRLHREDRVTSEQLNELHDIGVIDIDILFSKKIIAYLVINFPAKYRKPVVSLSFMDIDKVIYAYSQINKRSNRKRYLISSDEIPFPGKPGDLLLEYGEHLTFEKWNQIKTKLDKSRKIDFRYSERGIIVLIDLRPELENYTQRFFNNSHLISILVGKQEQDKTIICRDFVGTVDVMQVENATTLLDCYTKSRSRLIIIGDQLTEEYKKALAKVKKWDRYARFLVLTQFNVSYKDNLLKEIQKAYLSDTWNVNDF